MEDNNLFVHGLKPQGSYLVAYNCKPHTSKGHPVVEIGRELENRPGGYLDSRLNIVSFDNTMDAVEYFNYFKLLTDSANQKLQSKDYMSGKFVALLDSGFVPFYIPPTFFPKELREFFIHAIYKSGVQFYEYEAMNFDGQSVYAEEKDIWVSKMQAADYMEIGRASCWETV